MYVADTREEHGQEEKTERERERENINEVKSAPKLLDTRANQCRNQGTGTLQIFSVAYSQAYDLKCYKCKKNYVKS